MNDINENLKLNKAERKSKNLRYLPLTPTDLDDAFYVFAIRVTSEDSKGKRKLKANKFYYLFDGFTVYEDRILVSKERYKKTIYDYYMNIDSSSPHISISAIVGENGAGKSSIVEFELRLINNFSAEIFGEYAKVEGWPHLHFIDGVEGELYYVLKQNVYCLSVKDRDVKLYCYYWQKDEEDDKYVFNRKNNIILRSVIPRKGSPINSVYYTSYFDSIKELLPRFFYTIVLNQSVYAYNTRDFKAECNNNEYEAAVRKMERINNNGERIPYSIEERCWLSGLFHKNDGYQIPIVLMPYRKEGNYDINLENRLAFERLISIMVRADESERIINGHLKVSYFILKQKSNNYDIDYLHRKVGYSQFTSGDFEKMKHILFSCWSDYLGYDILAKRKSCLYRTQAKNYMVYKTLKIAETYDGYRNFRYDYNVDKKLFNESDFTLLVKQTIADNSHVTNKLFRTIAYLIFDIYEVDIVNKEKTINLNIEDITKKWLLVFKDEKLNLGNRMEPLLWLEAAIPPPFFDTSIGLVDKNTGVYVPFEYLSSGEKQQAFSISSLVYHLKNIDSVSEDRNASDRAVYENVQLILEEVELYYHPELQRQFVINLLDGIKDAGLNHIKWINICIITHSPFVLSDIPASNVLALKKNASEIGKIPCFAANIHDMLKLSFFLDKGSVGNFASWTTTRIAKCLKIARWINGSETAPEFFNSMKEIPEEYKFLEEFKTIFNEMKFDKKGFNFVYSSDIILNQINMIEEPIVRRILLDDFKRTFTDKKDEYKESMRTLLKAQLDALDD